MNKKNVLLTYYSNIKNIDGIKVFINSIKKIKHKSFDVVIFDASDETNTELDNFLNKQTTVNVIKIAKEINCLFIDRFLAYKNYIEKSNYDNFILTDITDIYFQKDPFLDLEKDTEYLYLISENILIKDAPWNFNIIKNLYGQEIADALEHKKVINSGVIAGSKNNIINLCDAIVNEYNLINKPFIGADQGILMKIAYLDTKYDIIFKTAPHIFCIIMAVFFYYPNKLIRHFGVNISNSIITDQKRNLYSIVHQYNRNKNLEKAVIDFYEKR